MGLPIRRAAAEPPDDIHALIASFRPDALRVARKLVRSQAEAEDLAQTAVMNVLARAHAISDPAFVKPYLLTTVRNLWRNQIRAGTRCHPTSDELLFDRMAADDEPDEPRFSATDVDTLKIAMGTLSKAKLELIQLRYVERLDYATIGQRLGVTAATARQRVHRAREQLRAACFSNDENTSKHACQLTRVRLGRYARSGLSRRIAARVTLHLRSCHECRATYSHVLEICGLDPNPEVFPPPGSES